jgi:hypothetical protein
MGRVLRRSVLVGTSTALSNFSYEATSTLSPQIQLIGSTASTAHLGIVRTSGNGASYLTLGWGSDGNVAASNQYIGVLLFSAFDGSVYRNAAYIQCEADGAHAAGDTPGRLLFSTTADGASSPTERLRINSVGQTMVNSAGTAAAPVISKVGDTNTGIFFPAADTIAFAEGGVERARIDSRRQALTWHVCKCLFWRRMIQIEDATGSGSGRIALERITISILLDLEFPFL